MGATDEQLDFPVLYASAREVGGACGCVCGCVRERASVPGGEGGVGQSRERAMDILTVPELQLAGHRGGHVRSSRPEGSRQRGPAWHHCWTSSPRRCRPHRAR